MRSRVFGAAARKNRKSTINAQAALGMLVVIVKTPGLLAYSYSSVSGKKGKEIMWGMVKLLTIIVSVAWSYYNYIPFSQFDVSK